MIQHDQIQVIRVDMSRWCSNLLVFCQNYVTYHATFHTTLLHAHFFKYTNCSFRCSLSSWFWPRPENIMFHDTSNEPNSPKTPASKKPGGPILAHNRQGGEDWRTPEMNGILNFPVGQSLSPDIWCPSATQRWELVRHRYFRVWTYWDWHSPKLVISIQFIYSNQFL